MVSSNLAGPIMDGCFTIATPASCNRGTLGSADRPAMLFWTDARRQPECQLVALVVDAVDEVGAEVALLEGVATRCRT